MVPGDDPLAPGSLDAYATVVKRFPISYRFAIRTTGHLGTSELLFDVYGASAGNVGIYAAFSLLGIEWKLGDNLKVTIDPAEVALPTPQLNGAPLVYRQYRLSLGWELGS